MEVTRTAVVGVVGVMLAGALALAGCTSGATPDTSSSPSRTPVATVTPKSRDQKIADAEAALVNYIKVSDEVRQDHFHHWSDKLASLTSSTVQEWNQKYNPEAESAGYYQIGTRSVEKVVPRSVDGGLHEGSPAKGTTDGADLVACIDSSGVQLVMPEDFDLDGQDANPPPGRYSVSVSLIYWPAGGAQGGSSPSMSGRWRVDDYSIDWGSPGWSRPECADTGTPE